MTPTPARLPLDHEKFLGRMRGLSFSKVGAYMLVRCHLLLSPSRTMTRAGIHAAIGTRSGLASDLIDETIAEFFDIDTAGLVFSAAVERVIAHGAYSRSVELSALIGLEPGFDAGRSE